MWSRRQFIRTLGAAGCGYGLAQPSLAWWRHAARAAEATNTARRLIVIELQGGNDGLNTVVPFADDAYYRARPTLAIKPDDVLKLDDHLGLHPSLKGWKSLWDAGKLAVVENCGYPQPNRSHFESMDVWHCGQVEQPTPVGWLGRAADLCAAGDLCFVGPGTVPHALARHQLPVTALERLSDLRLRRDADSNLQLGSGDDLANAIAQRLSAAKELSTKLPRGGLSGLSMAVAGNNRQTLQEHLNVIKTLMTQDQPYRVYYTVFDGFDTHADQRERHASLLRQVSEAVTGFHEDLRKQKLSDGVTIFLFSEFGRRVRENGSQGTDHGAAAPVFVIGDRAHAGVQGGVPNLTDLDQDDLRFKIDFRDVYSALLRDALGVEPTPALGSRPAGLKLVDA